MKKILSFVLAVSMALSLAACGSSTTGADTETDAATTAEETTAVTAAKTAAETTSAMVGQTYEIGVCIYKFDDNFMTLYREELERYLEEDLAEKTGAVFNVSVQDSKNDQTEQTNQIQNYITAGVDVLIINLVQSSAAQTVVDMCKAADIPVVFINREPDVFVLESWDKACYVGADARQSGTYQGELILATSNKGDINGDGIVKYIMVQGDPENIDAQYRTEYSIKALEDDGMEVELLDMQRGNWDQAMGQEIVSNALTLYGNDIEVVFCNNDGMALGAKQAIEAAGRVINEDIYLVGVDALEEVVGYIGENKFTGTVFNDYLNQSGTAANVAIQLINGEAVENNYPVDYVMITSDNAKTYLDDAKLKQQEALK